ncbi:hypothetical protein [Flagellimonas sp.]|uniref:hypothetical protein n=1 Tax=Flagellimonas sp. TaxID=2058762 RepID=UPI003F4A2967
MTHSKKYIYLKYTIITALLSIAFITNLSSQQTPAERLVGNWYFDEVSSFATMDTRSRTQMDTIPQLKSQVLNSYRGRRLFISQDGSCSLALANGQTAVFSWSLANDGTLTLTNANGTTVQESVRVLTPNRLVLVPSAKGNARSIIAEQHFIRQ